MNWFVKVAAMSPEQALSALANEGVDINAIALEHLPKLKRHLQINHHPDKTPNASPELFQQLNEKFARLMNAIAVLEKNPQLLQGKAAPSQTKEDAIREAQHEHNVEIRFAQHEYMRRADEQIPNAINLYWEQVHRSQQRYQQTLVAIDSKFSGKN